MRIFYCCSSIECYFLTIERLVLVGGYLCLAPVSHSDKTFTDCFLMRLSCIYLMKGPCKAYKFCSTCQMWPEDFSLKKEKNNICNEDLGNVSNWVIPSETSEITHPVPLESLCLFVRQWPWSSERKGEGSGRGHTSATTLNWRFSFDCHGPQNYTACFLKVSFMVCRCLWTQKNTADFTWYCPETIWAPSSRLVAKSQPDPSPLVPLKIFTYYRSLQGLYFLVTAL